MITHNLGYPRIGNNREIKKAIEGYWSGKINYNQLIQTSSELKQKNWLLQKDSGIDLIPSNDFSFYDHVLDMAFTVNAIPERYSLLAHDSGQSKLNLYFAMARGYQEEGADIIAMEMTKWFDTNYHYIVPEFYKNQKFSLFDLKYINEFLEAKKSGIITKPVLLGPVSFLLLGKEKEPDFDRIDLLQNLLPVYFEMLKMLISNGAEWIQFDEPFLVSDLLPKQKAAFKTAYLQIRENFPEIHILVASYFEGLQDNSELAMTLPVDAIHIDLVKEPEQLEQILNLTTEDKILSLGIVDGRNIWKNNFENSLKLINTAIGKIGEERVMIAPSCSLLHVPCDLDLETNEQVLSTEIKQWFAFAKQKIEEVVILKQLSVGEGDEYIKLIYQNNRKAFKSRETSQLIHNDKVRDRVKLIEQYDGIKRKPFPLRKKKQQKNLDLPSFPTTTIGSFPQTSEVRSWRAKLKKKELTLNEYNRLIKAEIERIIHWQEDVGLDVLVHGEFERNDMVEYFGEMLDGFTFTSNGWVQSYGTRCVKPPIIFGDVQRPIPMTVDWIKYAQSLTTKPVKGMLTGPVTILEWSFVRNDQPRSETCFQIALAIREEVLDLERANIRIIQLDEPALREGLPLRKKDWKSYLDWSVKAFRLTYAGVRDETQIHTHMCYSEFNDIIHSITAMDADVITIECSRSQMELLDAFKEYEYPNDIGPGVYDIHSPRIPTSKEMVDLLKKASVVIPKENIWINPDCGLKTRGWNETNKAIIEMVNAARLVREYSTD
jgi:5-methyltetrahydropteroyltriglutamate--homocysteine methyltransferase